VLATFLLAFVLLEGAFQLPPSPAPVATFPAPAAAAPYPVESVYRIHPSDIIAVTVYGDATLSQTVSVLPGGEIYYPLVGRIRIDNQTPDQAARAIAAALKKFVRDPIVTVTIVQQGQIGVLVLGNVKNPGKYSLPSTSRVSDALAAAGGLAPVNGEFPVARLAEADGATQQVPLQKLLHDGDTTTDAKLANGATLYVPAPAAFSVEVFGAVDRPGEIQLHEGDYLAMAIARAGASGNASPDLNHVQVRRVADDGSPHSFTVNLYDELKAGDVSKDFVMHKGDIVYVPQARKSIFNSIINGAGASLLILLRGLSGL
jgi:polysaccharide export outer membrane protein